MTQSRGPLLVLVTLTTLRWRRPAQRAYRSEYRLDAALYLFMLLFIASQGMFMISNPRETWILIWLPLAIVFSVGSRASST